MKGKSMEAEPETDTDPPLNLELETIVEASTHAYEQEEEVDEALAETVIVEAKKVSADQVREILKQTFEDWPC